MLKFAYDQTEKVVGQEELSEYVKKAENALQLLYSGNGAGGEFTGWIELPGNHETEEFMRLKAVADRIRSISQVLVVIGIGGSYLGARAGLSFLERSLSKDVEVIFAGNCMSTAYLSSVIDKIGDRDFSLNVISKSGTTIEPAVSFRIFKEMLEKKYGKDGARERIVCTTDKCKGALRQKADMEGYETFIVPDDIGGRYSVLTPVGLFPMAVAGVDIDKLLAGAKSAKEAYHGSDNAPVMYAAVRNALYDKGLSTEVMAAYEPGLYYFMEWWKQLYGESEGKENKGIFPASMIFTTDLHSMGQYMQEGARILMETVLDIEDCDEEIIMSTEEGNWDGLNYLDGKSLNEINHIAMEATIKAHVDGGVPNMKISVSKADEEALGQLFYFFELACGISGYMMEVNPFNQPGVEAYKKNMYDILKR